MAFNLENLEREIAEGSFRTVYLVTGDDGYLKQQIVNKLTDSVVPAGLETFNYHKLDGTQTDPDEISDYAEALPAMCERTCVLVHDYSFDSADSVSRQKLIELLSDPPETCVLVFWEDAVKSSFSKSEDLKKIKKLIESNGAICIADKLNDSAAREEVIKLCKSLDRQIDYSTANYIVECVGLDMGLLIAEVEKVCAYTQSAVTRADVDAVVTKSAEASVFEIVDSLLVNNFDKAFGALAVLFDKKTEPTIIMGAIISTYADIYRAKAMKSCGYGEAKLKEAYPKTYKSDFKLQKATRNAAKFSMAGARACLEVLKDADEALKFRTTGISERTIIEKLLIELVVASKKR